MKHLHYLFFTCFLLSCFCLKAQTYTMGSAANVSTCGGTFYDDGGAGGNYSPTAQSVMTFSSSTPGEPICFVFSQFATENFYDSLIVYNGSNTNAPILGGYTGSTIPASFCSSNPSNSLTFRFVSDGSIQSAGWKADIFCGALPPPHATPCDGAPLFCTWLDYDLTANLGTIAQTGPDYDCLFTQPNPIWFKLVIAQSGMLGINISNTSDVDVDFVMWGPVVSNQPCNSLTAANVVDCSYSSGGTEHADIANAIAGQTYVLCVTNYSNEPTNIHISTDPTTTANTLCGDGTCHITGGAINMSDCDNVDSIDVSWSLYVNSPLQTGVLYLGNNFGDTTILSLPLNMPVLSYVSQVPNNADSIRVWAAFSDDSSCVFEATYAVVPSALSTHTTSTSTSNSTEQDGTVKVFASGGIPPYNYVWNTGTFGSTLIGLGVGMYTVTVTDALGCTAVDTAYVAAQQCEIVLYCTASYCEQGGAYYSTDVFYSLHGAPSVGDLVIEVEGNAYSIPAPYNANNFQYTAPPQMGSAPVHISAYFTSDTACRVTDTASTIINPLTVSVSVTNANNAFLNNGGITVTVNSGVEPISYSWSTGDTQDYITGLTPGTYKATITDALGCYSVVSATVNAGVGIAESTTLPNLTIIPNPANDVVLLQFEKAFAGVGYVYGTDGKLFDTFAINNQVETLNIGKLPSGVYIMHVKEYATNAVSYTRLVKY